MRDMSDLFATDFTRTFPGPIDIRESIYDYFNRSARPEAERGREIMNGWYEAYPHDEKNRLRRCLCSGRRETFEGALFELYLHALLRACEFRVLVQPKAEQGLTPDFRVEDDGGRPFWVEATIVRQPQRVESHDTQIYQLNKRASPHVTVPGFAVHLRSATRGHENLRPGHFAAFLDRWFGEAKSVGVLPPLTQAGERIYLDERSGWRLELVLLSFIDPSRKPDRVICSQMGPFGLRYGCEGKERFRDAIREKVRHYRGLDLPLVVAVAFNDFHVQPTDDEIAKALLGDLKLGDAWPDAPDVYPRNDKGIWCRDSPEKHGSPVGVIYVPGCYPSGLAMPRVCLWDNPSIDASTLFRPWPLTRVGWPDRRDQPTVRVGQSAAAVLGIER